MTLVALNSEAIILRTYPLKETDKLIVLFSQNYGKIRGDIFNWANQKEVISKILNISPAGAAHGGDGAFFVYLRKNKP